MTTGQPAAAAIVETPALAASTASKPLPLLCESCGYDIDSLPTAAACPECGRAINESLPENRRGSPWQQRPSLTSLARTNYRLLRRPHDVFARVRLDVRSGLTLALANSIIAAALLVYPWTGILIGDPLRRSRGAITTALWVVPLQILWVAAALLALTGVEWIGIQLIARRRRWRLTPAAAWQVCAHATVGWIVMAVAMWIALIIWLNAIWLIPGLPQGGKAGDLTMLGVPVLGLIAGLLAFELLVWTGAQRCRYANPPRRSPEYAEIAE